MKQNKKKISKITSTFFLAKQNLQVIKVKFLFIFYLGYGDPFIGFCPYFLHAHISEVRLSTGT